MKNNMGVVVNLNEYHQQQRNEKQKEREKRKEAQQNLHRFSGVGDASFGMEDEERAAFSYMMSTTGAEEGKTAESRRSGPTAEWKQK